MISSEYDKRENSYGCKFHCSIKQKKTKLFNAAKYAVGVNNAHTTDKFYMYKLNLHLLVIRIVYLHTIWIFYLCLVLQKKLKKFTLILFLSTEPKYSSPFPYKANMLQSIPVASGTETKWMHHKAIFMMKMLI